MPTGAGKSYEVAAIIKELAQLYGDDKKAFDTQVLRIRSNRDAVLEKLMYDIKYIYQILKKVDDAESAFRKGLTKRIERNFIKKKNVWLRYL